MCLMSYANNKGADQPAHSRSLISAFVVRCLDSISLDPFLSKTCMLFLLSICHCSSVIEIHHPFVHGISVVRKLSTFWMFSCVDADVYRTCS